MFLLCYSKTYYTGNLEVYCGKQPKVHTKSKIHLSVIVQRLVHHLKGSMKNLTTYNWYSSFPLANTLFKDYKITIIRTLKKIIANCHLNSYRTKIERIDRGFLVFKKIVVVSFIPKKNGAVSLLSTMHECTGNQKIIIETIQLKAE